MQFPNAPLIIAFLAGTVASRTHNPGHAYLAAIPFLAFGIWAYEELLHGVNWFRHLLGLAYGIANRCASCTRARKLDRKRRSHKTERSAAGSEDRTRPVALAAQTEPYWKPWPSQPPLHKRRNPPKQAGSGE